MNRKLNFYLYQVDKYIRNQTMIYMLGRGPDCPLSFGEFEAVTFSILVLYTAYFRVISNFYFFQTLHLLIGPRQWNSKVLHNNGHDISKEEKNTYVWISQDIAVIEIYHLIFTCIHNPFRSYLRCSIRYWNFYFGFIVARNCILSYLT